MLTSKQVVEKLKNARNVAIFAHENPDPDAYGSMFAMRDICKACGANAAVFAVKNPRGYLDEIFPLQDLRTDFAAKDFDLVVFVDQHQIDRTDNAFVEELNSAKNILIIDHHALTENETAASQDYIIQSQKSAASEIICDIVRENSLKIDEQIATYLWTGLIGDTGRFLHNNLSPNVLEDAKFLLEQGANAQKVYDNMYRKNSYRQLKLHAEFIKKIKLTSGGKGGYVIFRNKDFKRLKIDREAVKRYSNELVNLEGVQISVLVIQYGKRDFKYSVRSRDVDALSVVTKYGGGGHENACGFSNAVSGFKVEKFVKNFIEEVLNG